jgi:O-antigen/teichoic acid export membrane protein
VSQNEGPVLNSTAAPTTRGSLGGRFTLSLVTSAGTVLLSVVTGVLTARLLGTEGRGQVAAISAWLLTLSWGASLGFSDAMVYHQAKRFTSTATIVATTLLSVPLLGALGVGMAQLLVSVGFSAQTSETQSLARAFLCAVPFVLGLHSVWALLIGQQRFRDLNIVRLAQPMICAVGFAVLAAANGFTVRAALLVQVGSYALVLLVAGVSLVRSAGFALPSVSLSVSALGYGLRLQGVALGQLLTARLDLLMLPAFVAAAGLGYYSVAVSVASMVAVLFGGLGMVVFPVAASADREQAADVVERGVRLTFFGGTACVIVLALSAPTLIPLVYGNQFAAAVPALWLLLPGIVLWSASSVLGSGLQAANRPGLASVAQLLAMVVTLVGLAGTIPRFGIEGAAATSTVAYGVALVLNLLFLKSALGISLRTCLSPLALMEDLRSIPALDVVTWKRRGDRHAKEAS